MIEVWWGSWGGGWSGVKALRMTTCVFYTKTKVVEGKRDAGKRQGAFFSSFFLQDYSFSFQVRCSSTVAGACPRSKFRWYRLGLDQCLNDVSHRQKKHICNFIGRLELFSKIVQ